MEWSSRVQTDDPMGGLAGNDVQSYHAKSDMFNGGSVENASQASEIEKSSGPKSHWGQVFTLSISEDTPDWLYALGIGHPNFCQTRVLSIFKALYLGLECGLARVFSIIAPNGTKVPLKIRFLRRSKTWSMKLRLKLASSSRCAQVLKCSSSIMRA
jgi:hypothetical protein